MKTENIENKTVTITRWMDHSVIFKSTKTTMAEALAECIEAQILDLRSADLRSANLSSADLSSVNLSYADLRSANLRYADLSSVNLSYANLSSADLSPANLSYADLSSANLSSANLRYADLSYANLSSANLSSADLSSANLSSADLSSADLSSADLSSADLRSADLSYANLSSAQNSACAIAQTLIVPQDGDLTGYKKLSNGTICKLLIKDGVKRHNATGRKCRCERAMVLSGEGTSAYDSSLKYKVGKEVVATNYDPNRWNECGGGIHFFITKAEAENYEQ